jgi:hypothetical protein|tara:strand:+ start:408 stop:566 length:159 start_codon:yes stop_codon:yes gene_type:complete
MLYQQERKTEGIWKTWGYQYYQRLLPNGAAFPVTWIVINKVSEAPNGISLTF